MRRYLALALLLIPSGAHAKAGWDTALPYVDEPLWWAAIPIGGLFGVTLIFFYDAIAGGIRKLGDRQRQRGAERHPHV